MVQRENGYVIDAELGRFSVNLLSIRQEGQQVFATSGEVLPPTGPREAYQTICLRDLLLSYPCDLSYRKSAEKLNRVLWRKGQDEIRARTIANLVEREGKAITETIQEKVEQTLKEHGFSSSGQPAKEERPVAVVQDVRLLPVATIQQAINQLNQVNEKKYHITLEKLKDTFEDPSSIKANISLDDVYSKKQKETGRSKNAPPKTKKEKVKNTIAHLQNNKSAVYLLNAPNITQMMQMVLAFLLTNALLSVSGQLLFFIDGAADLRVAIQDIFHFTNFKIILDWYHLEKKCQERLSLACRGKEIRNTILGALVPLLWFGQVEQAIEYLTSLDENLFKSKEEIRRLIDYFLRNRDFIPCYALRKQLGLRVSSNRVEKANDLVVSSRQKHNGMSWSTDGSTSLATLTSLDLNDERDSWLHNGNIPFTFKKPKPAQQPPTGRAAA